MNSVRELIKTKKGGGHLKSKLIILTFFESKVFNPRNKLIIFELHGRHVQSRSVFKMMWCSFHAVVVFIAAN